MVQREEEDREGAGRLDVDVDEPAVLEVADELAALAERERVSPEEPPARGGGASALPALVQRRKRTHSMYTTEKTMKPRNIIWSAFFRRSKPLYKYDKPEVAVGRA